MLETTVQFRQVINGLPAVWPDAGDVRVTLDNDGTLVDVDFGGGIRKRYEVIAPIVG